MLRPSEDGVLKSVHKSEPRLKGCSTELLAGGKSGARIFRLWPKSGSAGAPLILKTIRAEDVPTRLMRGFPRLVESEVRFFTDMAPRLRITRPRIAASGQTEDGVYYLLMEDLSLCSRFVGLDHKWSNDEMVSVIEAYALLHGRSTALFRTTSPPEWLGVDVRDRFDKDAILGCFLHLASDSLTSDVVDKVPLRLVSNTLDVIRARLADIPAAVLHNDPYPGNVALPLEGGSAILIDWQLAALGPPHLEVASLGLFGHDQALAEVDHAMLAKYYLAKYCEETGLYWPLQDFVDDCRLARLMLWRHHIREMVDDLRRFREEGVPLRRGFRRQLQSCVNVCVDVIGKPTFQSR